MSPRFAVVILTLMMVIASGFMAGCFDDPAPEKTNKAPVASFYISSNKVLVGEELRLDAGGSVDEDGEIVAYTWNLGDGTVSDEMTLTHSYAEEGTYTIKLTVTDDGGKTAFVTETVEVDPLPSSDGMVADGDLGDWSDKVVFTESDTDGKGSVEMVEYSIHKTGDSLFFYAKTEGAFPGDDTHRTVLQLILDTDNDPDTGYRTHGIGGDMVVKTQLLDGAVLSTASLRYTGDGYAFDGFSQTGNGAAVLSGDTLEGYVPLETLGTVGASMKAVFALQFFGGEDLGDWVVSPGKTALRIEQRCVMDGPAAIGTNQVLNITLTPGGGEVNLETLELYWDGLAPFGHGDCRITSDGNEITTGASTTNSYMFSFLPSYTISDTETWEVSVTISGDETLLRTTSFGLFTDADGVASDGVALVVPPTNGLFYLVEAPGTPSVDGTPGDTGYTPINDPAEGSGMDITFAGAYKRADGAVFWALEATELFAGNAVPTEYNAKLVAYDDAGSDTVVLYFDMDGNPTTGKLVQGIGCDIRVVLKGREGMVTSAQEQLWSNTDWGPAADTWYVMKGDYIEGTFMYQGAVLNPTFTFESTSWYNDMDLAPGPAGF